MITKPKANLDSLFARLALAIIKIKVTFGASLQVLKLRLRAPPTFCLGQVNGYSARQGSGLKTIDTTSSYVSEACWLGTRPGCDLTRCHGHCSTVDITALGPLPWHCGTSCLGQEVCCYWIPLQLSPADPLLEFSSNRSTLHIILRPYGHA